MYQNLSEHGFRGLSIRRIAPIVGLIGCVTSLVATADTIGTVVRMHVEGTPGAEDKLMLMRKAAKFFDEEKYDQSLSVLEQARDKYPHLPRGRVSLALMLMEAGKLKPAQFQLEIAASQGKESPYAHDGFGRLALAEGRLTDAELQFDRASELMEASGRKRRWKDRFIQECDLGLATVAERRRNWSEAQKYLSKALRFKPNDPPTQRRRAVAIFHQGDIDEAYTELIKANSSADESVEPASLTMARLFSKQEEFEQAETWIKRAQMKRPDDSRIALAYASWLMDQRRFEEAAKQAELAVENGPDQASTQLLLGLLAMANEELERAEEYFQQLHSANPASFEISNLLALVLADQSDPAKQEKSQQLAEVNVRQYPRNVQANFTLGWIYHRLGRMAEAKQLMANASSGGAMSPDNAYLVARVMFGEGQDDADSADRDDDSKVAEVQKLLQSAIDAQGRFIRLRQAERWLEELQEANQEAREPDQEGQEPDQPPAESE